MKQFKTYKAAYDAYAKLEKSIKMPFEQWLFEESTEVDYTLEIDSASDCYSFLKEHLHFSRRRESFYVVLVDAWHKPLCMPITISNGLLNGTPAGAREVFAPAIWWNAASVIVAHNHPSNNCLPSNKDVVLTKELIKASKILRIPLIDHMIFGKDTFVSMREDKYCKF